VTRQFLVVGHDAPTTPDFSLDDLPGAGRMDLLARTVVAALLRSHGVRADSRVHVVLDGAYTLVVDGATVRHLRPDERSTAARVRDALDARDEAIGTLPAEPSPGVELYRGGLGPALDRAAADAGRVVLLDADGDPAAGTTPPDDPLFVLSDHHDFTASDREAVADHDPTRLSLGPVALHADQAITVAHNWLDTDGFAPDYHKG
jgi:tRNA (pseudouridine54-N1)-methyltransferase